jgi:hypothetical protein
LAIFDSTMHARNYSNRKSRFENRNFGKGVTTHVA